MEEARNPVHGLADALCDAFNQIGDFSYAVMPRDVAHALGDLKKAMLNSIRGCIDWEIDWIDDRVTGGDKLRDEWREKCSSETDPSSGTAV
jgi:hypothetical protein